MTESPQDSSQSQAALDAHNASFWDELCGTALAQQLGITDRGPAGLQQFDDAYFGIYPYLAGYVSPEVNGRKALEIGLGYGTLGQLLATRGAAYSGLDIAEGPVRMMRSRLNLLGLPGADRVVQGSALSIPFPDGAFDFVYSIGCLHHTGDLPKSISEVSRVLAPGGTAVVMLYNAHSFRQLVARPLSRLKKRILHGRPTAEAAAAEERARYDANQKGEAAPHVEFVTRKQVRALFGKNGFGRISIDSRNFDNYALLRGRVNLPRTLFLDNLGRVLGLDLYITAKKNSQSR